MGNPHTTIYHIDRTSVPETISANGHVDIGMWRYGITQGQVSLRVGIASCFAIAAAHDGTAGLLHLPPDPSEEHFNSGAPAEAHATLERSLAVTREFLGRIFTDELQRECIIVGGEDLMSYGQADILMHTDAYIKHEQARGDPNGIITILTHIFRNLSAEGWKMKVYMNNAGKIVTLDNRTKHIAVKDPFDDEQIFLDEPITG